MRIYSWNMLYRNAELERAFDFVSEADFDIFCLQEVPEVFLEKLKALPFHIASHKEADVEHAGVRFPIYTVTLSRFPITGSKAIVLPPYVQPLRGKLAAGILYTLRLWGHAVDQRRFSSMTDIDQDGRSLRIFNLHLRLAYPALRLREFEEAMTERDPELPTIVCGDFNIVESPRVSLLNWLLGGKATDTLFYTRERSHIERRFVEHSLTNVMRGKVTHGLSRSQLDHILVSHAFRVQDASVLSDRCGSDHHPIRIETT